jgi:ribosome-associated toxin RatA of RatAB toxin-antitoxin module
VVANIAVSATFAVDTIDTYTLTYTAGAGGTIAGASPQTVALGGNGTLVTAVPSTGYHFVSWSDGSTTAARTDTNVTGNLSVTANFAINSYALTYTAGVGGTISGTVIQTVPYGGSGTAVTAVPSTGYHFVTWSDGVTTVARTDSGIVGNVTASATFAANTYQLHYTAGTGGTLGGTINQTVPYGGSGTAVTAVPNTGYHFVGWSDGLLTAARTDSSVAANITVAAVFAVTAPDTRTLTYTAGVGGTIVGTSPQTVSVDGNGTLVTAVPNTGYHFVSWSDGSTIAARTDTVVKADLLVSAVFAVNTYTLTYAAGSGGTISGTVIQTVPYGGSGTAVTAVPNTGYHFVRWSDGSATAARTDSGVVANIAVSATFAVDTIDTRTLTYTVGAGGTISGTVIQTVALGGNGTLVTAVPSAGYHFVSWSDGSTTAARTDTNVTGNLSVTATFVSASVATKLTMNVSPTRLSVGDSAHFYGVMAPNMPNSTPIALLVRKAGQTKWTRVGSYVRTYSAHHWSRYYHPNTRGTYYFKVRFSATAAYAGTTSRTVTVVWR